MTTSDDDPRWDPPLDQLAEVCATAAFMARDISLLKPQEPSGDLRELDTKIDQGAGVNILRFGHEATTGYLQGAGDLLHSIARLITENPAAVSPIVLARSTGEYSAFAWWLSDPKDSPNQRAGKARRIAQTALSEHTMDIHAAPFRKVFNTWSSRAPIKIAGKPDPEKLIRAMLGSNYNDQVKNTSWYVHAVAITLIQTIESAKRNHPRNRQAAWNEGLFALQAVIHASERVTQLRNGDLSAIAAAKRASGRLVDLLRDDHNPDTKTPRSAARGVAAAQPPTREF